MTTLGPTITNSGNGAAITGGVAWANTGFITANDGSFAQVSNAPGTDVGGFSSDGLEARFDGLFSIPAGSTIDGVQVDIKVKNASSAMVSLKVTNQFTSTGITRAVTVSSTSTLRTTGSSSDQWNTGADVAWTAASFNSGTVRVYMLCATTGVTDTTSIDYVQMTVFYTAPVGGLPWPGMNTTIQNIRRWLGFPPRQVTVTCRCYPEAA